MSSDSSNNYLQLNITKKKNQNKTIFIQQRLNLFVVRKEIVQVR